MRIERVKWKDASGDDESGWTDPHDLVDADTIIDSVGWVAKETDNYLTLAMDLDPNGATHTRGRIPKGLIVSRDVLFDSTKDSHVDPDQKA